MDITMDFTEAEPDKTGGIELPDLPELFPMPEFREHQEDALNRVQKAFSEGAKVVILNAPTGSGKSPLCATIAYGFGSAYLTTPLKSLQDQYADDGFPNIAQLKGRNNYLCPADPGATCAEGKCQYDKCSMGRLKRNCWDHGDLCAAKYDKRDPCSCDQHVCNDCVCHTCPYKEAVAEFLSSDIGCTNTTMMMVFPKFKKRKVLIVDEAHMVTDFALSHVSVTLSSYDIGDIPKGQTFSDRMIWLKAMAVTLDDKRQKLINILEKADVAEYDLVTRVAKITRTLRKIEFLQDDYETNKEPWVQDFSQWDVGKRTRQKLIMRPITVRRFLKRLLWDKADYIVLSDATPPDPVKLGLMGKCEMVTVPSTFPVKRRPWIFENCGKMTRKERAKTLPKMADKIAQIHALGLGKVLVHCHSYKLMDDLHDMLVAKRIIPLTQSREDRMGSLETWKARKDNIIFLSVNMYEGVSLDDDLCRVNVVIKCPFQFFGDPQVRMRLQFDGDAWYYEYAVEKVQQAYGRSTRSKKDQSITYILDGSFSFLLWKYKYHFRPWFMEARLK